MSQLYLLTVTGRTSTRRHHRHPWEPRLVDAYAAKLCGAEAVLVVPKGNNPEKNVGMRAWVRKLSNTADLMKHAIMLPRWSRLMAIDFCTRLTRPLLLELAPTLELFADVRNIDAVIVPIVWAQGSAASQ